MSVSDAEIQEDIRLLAALGAGDREAFRRFYARNSGSLFALARRLVGDAGTAEEVLQDTFVKIWRHAADYDARKARPFTWAVTLLRRTAIDQLRKSGRRPVTEALPGNDATAADDPDAVRRSAERREASARVHDALATLAPPQRTALELALYSTLTHTEIAGRLAQPVGTVKSWIRRGLLDLRATLHDSPP